MDAIRQAGLRRAARLCSAYTSKHTPRIPLADPARRCYHNKYRNRQGERAFSPDHRPPVPAPAAGVGAPVLAVDDLGEAVGAGDGADDDVAAVGPAAGDILLAAETTAAGAAVPGLDVDGESVNEGHDQSRRSRCWPTEGSPFIGRGDQSSPRPGWPTWARSFTKMRKKLDRSKTSRCNPPYITHKGASQRRRCQATTTCRPISSDLRHANPFKIAPVGRHTRRRGGCAFGRTSHSARDWP